VGAAVVVQERRPLPAVRCSAIVLPLCAARAPDGDRVGMLSNTQTAEAEAAWKVDGHVQEDRPRHPRRRFSAFMASRIWLG